MVDDEIKNERDNASYAEKILSLIIESPPSLLDKVKSLCTSIAEVCAENGNWKLFEKLLKASATRGEELRGVVSSYEEKVIIKYLTRLCNQSWFPFKNSDWNHPAAHLNGGDRTFYMSQAYDVHPNWVDHENIEIAKLAAGRYLQTDRFDEKNCSSNEWIRTETHGRIAKDVRLGEYCEEAIYRMIAVDFMRCTTNWMDGYEGEYLKTLISELGDRAYRPMERLLKKIVKEERTETLLLLEQSQEKFGMTENMVKLIKQSKKELYGNLLDKRLPEINDIKNKISVKKGDLLKA